jgi:hypothetical protein
MRLTAYKESTADNNWGGGILWLKRILADDWVEHLQNLQEIFHNYFLRILIVLTIDILRYILPFILFK